MRRSSVIPVCGTGPNTRRSPSLMRLDCTVWRWPGTAETPLMRWERVAYKSLNPTARRSPHRTETTITLRITVQPSMAVDGGTTTVQDRDWTVIISMAAGQSSPDLKLLKMSRPVTCWWKSTKFIWERYVFAVLFEKKLHFFQNCWDKGLVGLIASTNTTKRSQMRRELGSSAEIGWYTFWQLHKHEGAIHTSKTAQIILLEVDKPMFVAFNIGCFVRKKYIFFQNCWDKGSVGLIASTNIIS